MYTFGNLKPDFKTHINECILTEMNPHTIFISLAIPHSIATTESPSTSHLVLRGVIRQTPSSHSCSYCLKVGYKHLEGNYFVF